MRSIPQRIHDCAAADPTSKTDAQNTGNNLVPDPRAHYLHNKITRVDNSQTFCHIERPVVHSLWEIIIPSFSKNQV